MPEYDGQYEVEIKYSVDIGGVDVFHSHSFDVAVLGAVSPGAVFEDVPVETKGGAESDLGGFMNTYLDKMELLFGSGTALSEIILWKYDAEPATSKIFIASMALLPAWTGVGSPVAAMSAIFTFRVTGYRYPMRLYIMEGNLNSEERIPLSSMGAAYADYAEFIFSDDSILVGRSGGYPIASIALNSGQNEALRQIRYR